MNKREKAAWFFNQLGQDKGEFIAQMIESEMDEEIIELFNQFGGRLQLGDMEPNRFQTSLLIIGYLVRAHEEAEDSKENQADSLEGDEKDQSLH